MSIRRPLPVWINKLAVSPMLPGVFHPMIILTTEDCRPEEMRMILRHELTHYQRGDIFLQNGWSSWQSVYIGLIPLSA